MKAPMSDLDKIKAELKKHMLEVSFDKCEHSLGCRVFPLEETLIEELLDKAITLTAQATRERDIEVVEDFEEDWFLTAERNARDAIAQALRNL